MGHRSDQTETSSAVFLAALPKGSLVLFTSAKAGVVTTPLPEGKAMVLGRAPECDVVLGDGSVSRQHARLRVLEDRVLVEELNSKNGVSVGGRRVAPGATVEVAIGEAFAIGAVSSVVLRAEAAAMPTSAEPPVSARNFVAEAPSMKRLVALLERIAKSPLSVLLTGESGTGKEVFAQFVHQASDRSRRPFVPINCAALPETMLEAELFGYERGAFTGAAREKAGLFESADGGTLFLDEIGDLTPSLQAKLLRVLESGEVRRLGSLVAHDVNARLVCATNVDLASAVAEGRFRSDLLYRINGMRFSLPPLRERKEDISALAQSFLASACKRASRPELSLGPDAVRMLEAHSWPGNARELRNVMERAAAIAEGPQLVAKDLVLDAAPQASQGQPSANESTGRGKPRSDVADAQMMESWAQEERERVKKALAEARGNRTVAARILGVSRHTLMRRINELGLRDS